MDGHDKGNTSILCDSKADSTYSAKSMRMNHRQVRLSPQQGNQVERHQIAAQRDQLLLSCPGKPNYRDECIEATYLASCSHQRIMLRYIREARKINNGRNSMFKQAFDEALDGRFRPAPFRRVQLSEQVGNTHLITPPWMPEPRQQTKEAAPVLLQWRFRSPPARASSRNTTKR